MTKIIETNLELQNGYNIHVNDSYLDEFKTIDFAKSVMMGQEIKANNTIEGIFDDLSKIDEVIETKENLSSEDRKRIINLYHGYEYILRNKDINRETIADFYSLLSDELLDDYNILHTSRYHREAPVYIKKSSRIGGAPYTDTMAKCFFDTMFNFDSNSFNGIDVKEKKFKYLKLERYK